MNGDATSPMRPLSDRSDASRFLRTEGAGAGELFLPGSYGRLHVTLMVRDPRWLFAYWEQPWEGPPPHLALYETDASGAGRRLVSRCAAAACGSAYLPVPGGNRHYVAQLEEASGPPFAVSNVVYTPPEGPSELEDRFWLTLPALRHLTWVGAGTSPGVSAREALPSLWEKPASPLRWM